MDLHYVGIVWLIGQKHIDRIRKDYSRELKDELMANRQRATAVYLIDKFALRAGNEKGEDEADTVGCCSLKIEHVTLKPPNIVIFDFLGKDSIRFYDEVEVEPQVFKNLKIFKRDKGEQDELFDRLTVRKDLILCLLTTNDSIDFQLEQAPFELHERPDCQGLSYLQCLLYNVDSLAGPKVYWFHSGKNQGLQ